MIELKHITKVYNSKKQNEFIALNDISLDINDGSFTAIIGKSGSGKSTLLHIIGLLDSFSEGQYLLDGKSISKISEKEQSKIRARQIGFVKQDFALIEDYSVIENITLPLYAAKAADKKEKAGIALKKLGISELTNKSVSQLSGGEKQRVAIARAIVNNPKILLADEPTGSLDAKTGDDIFGVFKELNQQGITVILVTHDISLAQRCNNIVQICDGKIISKKM